GGERFGRYSFVGLAASTRLEIVRSQVSIYTNDTLTECIETPDPLQYVRQYLSRFKAAERAGLPRFCGGLVGYFGYDTVRWIEPRLDSGWAKPDAIGGPDALLLLSEELAVVDNLSGRLYLVVYGDPTRPDGYEAARARLQALAQGLRQPLQLPENGRHAPGKVES